MVNHGADMEQRSTDSSQENRSESPFELPWPEPISRDEVEVRINADIVRIGSQSVRTGDITHSSINPAIDRQAQVPLLLFGFLSGLGGLGLIVVGLGLVGYSLYESDTKEAVWFGIAFAAIGFIVFCIGRAVRRTFFNPPSILQVFTKRDSSVATLRHCSYDSEWLNEILQEVEDSMSESNRRSTSNTNVMSVVTGGGAIHGPVFRDGTNSQVIGSPGPVPELRRLIEVVEKSSLAHEEGLLQMLNFVKSAVESQNGDLVQAKSSWMRFLEQAGPIAGTGANVLGLMHKVSEWLERAPSNG